MKPTWQALTGVLHFDDLCSSSPSPAGWWRFREALALIIAADVVCALNKLSRMLFLSSRRCPKCPQPRFQLILIVHEAWCPKFSAVFLAFLCRNLICWTLALSQIIATFKRRHLKFCGWQPTYIRIKPESSPHTNMCVEEILCTNAIASAI